MLNTLITQLTTIRGNLNNEDYVLQRKAVEKYRKAIEEKQLIKGMEKNFLNLTPNEKMQLLTEVIKAGAVKLLEKLLKKLSFHELAEFLQTPLDRDNNTCLHLAARGILTYSGCLYDKCVRLQIEEGSFNAQAKALVGWNEPYREMITVLIKKGALVNRLNGAGQTPLMEAVQRGKDVETVKIFLKHGADVMLSNMQGETIFHLVVSDEYQVKAMLDVITAAILKTKRPEQLTVLWNQPDKQHRTPFHVLMGKTITHPILCAEQLVLIESLLPKAMQSSRRENPYAIQLEIYYVEQGGMLHSLVDAHASPEKIRYFIEAVPDRHLNFRDIYGNTAMHQAVLHYAYYTQQLNSAKDKLSEDIQQRQLKQQQSEALMTLLISHRVDGGENLFHLRPVDLTEDATWKQKLLAIETDVKVDLPIYLKALEKALSKQKLNSLLRQVSEGLLPLKTAKYPEARSLVALYLGVENRYREYGALYDFLFDGTATVPDSQAWLRRARQALAEEKQALGLLPEIEERTHALKQSLKQQFDVRCVNSQEPWGNAFEHSANVVRVLRGLKAAALVLTQHLYDVFFLQHYLDLFEAQTDKQRGFAAVTATVNEASARYETVVKQESDDTTVLLAQYDVLTTQLLALIRNASPDAELAKSYFSTVLEQWSACVKEGETHERLLKTDYPLFLAPYVTRVASVSPPVPRESTPMSALLIQEGTSPLHRSQKVRTPETSVALAEPCRFGYSLPK